MSARARTRSAREEIITRKKEHRRQHTCLRASRFDNAAWSTYLLRNNGMGPSVRDLIPKQVMIDLAVLTRNNTIGLEFLGSCVVINSDERRDCKGVTYVKVGVAKYRKVQALCQGKRIPNLKDLSDNSIYSFKWVHAKWTAETNVSWPVLVAKFRDLAHKKQKKSRKENKNKKAKSR